MTFVIRVTFQRDRPFPLTSAVAKPRLAPEQHGLSKEFHRSGMLRGLISHITPSMMRASGKRSDCFESFAGSGLARWLDGSVAVDAFSVVLLIRLGNPAIQGKTVLTRVCEIISEIAGYIHVFWQYRYQELLVFVLQDPQPKAVVESGLMELAPQGDLRMPGVSRGRC
jgi:hypothetical protein